VYLLEVIVLLLFNYSFRAATASISGRAVKTRKNQEDILVVDSVVFGTCVTGLVEMRECCF
jgi:hypothetical protein